MNTDDDDDGDDGDDDGDDDDNDDDGDDEDDDDEDEHDEDDDDDDTHDKVPHQCQHVSASWLLWNVCMDWLPSWKGSAAESLTRKLVCPSAYNGQGKLQ